MQVLKFPDPLLFQKSETVTVFGEELQILLDSMWETMKSSKGIGLAAIQVGIPLRMFVMENQDGRHNIINPSVLERSRISAQMKEGCLSAPGEFIVVPDRVQWIQISYFNEKGEGKISVFKGIHSVCVQHEMEHLDGIGFMENKSVSRQIRKGLQKRWGIK